MKKLLVLPLLLTLLSACGGDDGDVLHLAGQDITAKNYRAHVQKQAATDPQGMQSICKLVDGVDTSEAAKVLKNLSASAAPVVWTGATPKPGQADNGKDYETATGILQDECKR